MKFKFLENVTRIDMDLLHKTNPLLRSVVRSWIPGTGYIADWEKVPVDIKDQLDRWLERQQKKALDKLGEDAKASEQWRETKAKMDAELDQAIATRQREIAAEKRLQEYYDVGLVDSAENQKRISDWLASAAKGFVSAANLDAAIKILGNKLDWRKTEPPAPTPKPAVVILGTCSDGKPQLPINTFPNYSHSVAQLHDLLKRQSQ